MLILWGFWDLCSSGILGCNLSCDILVWFWHQGNAVLLKWVWKSSILFHFLEEFEKNWYWFFKLILDRIHQWSHLDLGHMYVGRFLITDSISLLLNGLFGFISSSFSLDRWCVSRNLPISCRLSNLLAYSCS